MVVSSWLTASLMRAKRIPPLQRLLRMNGDGVQILTPEEAAAERARHQDLTKRLAPDATATSEQLQAFINRQEEEFRRKRLGRRS